MRDALVAEINQMLGGQCAALFVIWQHRGCIGIITLRIGKHDGHAKISGRGSRAAVQPARCKHEAIDPLRQQLCNMALLDFGIIRGVAEENRDLLFR